MQRFTRIPKLLLLDEAGFIASSEMILLATIVMIGTIAGTVTVRDTIATELADLGSAVKGVDQSYSFGDVVTPCGTVSGSVFIDQTNFCTPGFSDDFPPTQLPPIVIGGSPSGGESG